MPVVIEQPGFGFRNPRQEVLRQGSGEDIQRAAPLPRDIRRMTILEMLTDPTALGITGSILFGGYLPRFNPFAAISGRRITRPLNPSSNFRKVAGEIDISPEGMRRLRDAIAAGGSETISPPLELLNTNRALAPITGIMPRETIPPVSKLRDLNIFAMTPSGRRFLDAVAREREASFLRSTFGPAAERFLAP